MNEKRNRIKALLNNLQGKERDEYIARVRKAGGEDAKIVEELAAKPQAGKKDSPHNKASGAIDTK